MTARTPVLLLALLALLGSGGCADRAPMEPDSGTSVTSVRGTVLAQGRVRANRHEEVFGEFDRSSVVTAGVGLFEQPATLDAVVPVADADDILQAWLYWSGRSLLPVGDETIVIDGEEHVGDLLASFEHSVTPSRFAFLYRLNVIDLVTPGANSLEISGFDLGSRGRPNGAGLVVVHRDQKGFAEIRLMELADFFYWADAEARSSGVHAFDLGMSDTERAVQMELFVGDGEAERPDALWWTLGEGAAPVTDLIGVANVAFDVLTANVGEQFDIVALDAGTIAAGTGHLAFQIESPASGDGDSGILSLAILCLGGEGVANLPPVCDAGGPYEGDVGAPTSFDGTGSFDPDGEVVAWSWDFGDGASGQGSSPEHTYTEPGEYTAILCVRDDGGAEECCAATVLVEADVEIVCDAGGPYQGTVRTPITFDASETVDPEGEIDRYLWDFGDGASAEGTIVTHEYVSEGTYTATVCLVDLDRAGGDNPICCETQVWVDAENIDPICDLQVIFEGDIYPGDQVEFDGSASIDLDGWLVEHAWDFGDGSTAGFPALFHIFTEPGTYEVQLCVTDNEGTTVCCTAEVIVLVPDTLPPVCALEVVGETEVLVGEEVQFSGVDSYDPDGLIFGWNWDFGDGATHESNDGLVFHAFSEPGEYVVTLCVTDDAYVTSCCDVTVFVSDGGAR